MRVVLDAPKFSSYQAYVEARSDSNRLPQIMDNRCKEICSFALGRTERGVFRSAGNKGPCRKEIVVEDFVVKLDERDLSPRITTPLYRPVTMRLHPQAFLHEICFHLKLMIVVR